MRNKTVILSLTLVSLITLSGIGLASTGYTIYPDDTPNTTGSNYIDETPDEYTLIMENVSLSINESTKSNTLHLESNNTSQILTLHTEYDYNINKYPYDTESDMDKDGFNYTVSIHNASTDTPVQKVKLQPDTHGYGSTTFNTGASGESIPTGEYYAKITVHNDSNSGATFNHVYLKTTVCEDCTESSGGLTENSIWVNLLNWVLSVFKNWWWLLLLIIFLMSLNKR